MAIHVEEAGWTQTGTHPRGKPPATKAGSVA